MLESVGQENHMSRKVTFQLPSRCSACGAGGSISLSSAVLGEASFCCCSPWPAGRGERGSAGSACAWSRAAESRSTRDLGARGNSKREQDLGVCLHGPKAARLASRRARSRHMAVASLSCSVGKRPAGRLPLDAALLMILKLREKNSDVMKLR